jgi:hypothetical protein
MAYARIIKLLQADGVTADESYYAGGLIDDCPTATFTLAARRGLCGGTFEVAGTARDPFRIPQGDVIQFWYDESTLLYRGIIRRRKRSVDGTSHVYEFDSYFAQITRASVNRIRTVFGSSVAADDSGATTRERRVAGRNTPEDIIRWLIDTNDADTYDGNGLIVPGNFKGFAIAAGVSYTYGVDIQASSPGGLPGVTVAIGPNTANGNATYIHTPPAVDGVLVSPVFRTTANMAGAQGIEVTEFVYEASADIGQVLEELELLASAGAVPATATTPEHKSNFCAGIDEEGHFYFKAVSAAAGDVQATFTIGSDALAGEEEHLWQDPTNQITVVGGMSKATGLITKQIYRYGHGIQINGLNAASSAKHMPALRFDADMQSAASGFFGKYGNPQLTVSNLSRVHADTDTPPRPWLGQVVFEDTARGVIVQDFSSQVDVTFDEIFDYSTSIGAASSTADGASSSSYATNVYGDELTDSIPGVDAWVDSLPINTDLVDAPTDYPTSMGPDIPLEGLADSLDPGVLADSGGGGGSPTIGGTAGEAQVMEFDYPGGASYGISGAWPLAPIVLISNGGNAALFDPTANPNPIRVHFVFVPTYGTSTSTGYLLMEKSSGASQSMELWVCKENMAFIPTGVGRVHWAVSAITKPAVGQTPETVVWWPADITAAQSLVNFPSTFIAGDASSGDGAGGDTYLNQAGWTVNGS